MSSDLKNWADWLVSCAGGGIPDEARAAYDALDRIEKLELELVEARMGWLATTVEKTESIIALNDQLAAEKALADRLAEDFEGYREEIDHDCKDSCCQYARETESVLAAHRKARGL